MDRPPWPSRPLPSIVLVVDDDPKFAAVVARSLTRAGYACRVAGSGAQALEAVTECDPAAVVLDVMMPPPDGYEVCARLRAAGRTCPIVLVSARVRPGERDRAEQAGADDFLGKPFPLGALTAAIDRLTTVRPDR